MCCMSCPHPLQTALFFLLAYIKVEFSEVFKSPSFLTYMLSSTLTHNLNCPQASRQKTQLRLALQLGTVYYLEKIQISGQDPIS